MSGFNNILARMREAIDNPRKVISDFENRTGKKAVGCFPPYVPEEIIHAAGLLPVGLWGGQVELNRVRAVLPAFACSIIQSIKEFEMKGEYDRLAAVVVPSSCDTLKAIGQKWSRAEVPCLQFVHPHNRSLAAAKEFLRGEYQHIRMQLEAITGEAITDDAISRSILIFNRHRQAMREFSQAAAGHPQIIDALTRHQVYKSAFFMEKEAHTSLVRELTELLNQEPVQPWQGIKAVVSGIMLEPDSVLEVFRDLNIAVICDDLVQESRQYRVDVSEEGEPLDCLAGMWQEMYGCSLAYEKEKSRVLMLRDMKEEYGADAVIIAMMKFCDPEEFDYPIIKKNMETYGIPLLQIEVDQQMQSTEQVRTRLQSFAEMIAQNAASSMS